MSTITLRGHFLAGIEYEALTGSSLEEAFEALLPQLQEYEDAQELIGEDGKILRKARAPKIVDAKAWVPVYLDLFWAFSSEWRDETGFDGEHGKPVEPKDPRKRGAYMHFMSMFHYRELVKVRNLVFGLILEAMSDPFAAESKGEAPRPEAATPEPSTIESTTT